MNSGFHTLLFTVVLSLGSILAHISLASGSNTLDDDWTQIKDLNDPMIRGIGKFAVLTHNSWAQSSLIFDHLVDGATKSDGGTNYKLTIAAKDDNGSETIRNYLALVINKRESIQPNYLVLISFTGPI